MLNRSASLAMSTSVLKALPGKLDIKRHSPSILYLQTVVRSLRFICLILIYLAHHDVSNICICKTASLLSNERNDKPCAIFQDVANG